VLEPVYEQEFYDGSYGFRRGRSAHDALDSINKRLWEMGGGWVLEADIEGFFDAVDHTKLQEIFRQRVSDGVLVRLIGKWLKAGVMEEGLLSRPDTGTPQGGVISPLLANIYLHEVLDKWFLQDVRSRLKGESHLVRYADDFLIFFEHESDARRVMAVLPKRFGKYGLRLHPKKTRLVEFESPRKGGDKKPGTFDFLGFRHRWVKSRKGNWVLSRSTAPKRVSRTLKSITRWCRENRHEPVREQHQVLSAKLRGHANYFGITGNSRALSAVKYSAQVIWRKWLSRRNNHPLNWARFNAMMSHHPLPVLQLSNRYRRARISTSRSRMRQLRTSGSVGALGRNPGGHPISSLRLFARR